MAKTSTCPGCDLELPSGSAVNQGYFNASGECLSMFFDTQAFQLGNLAVMGRSHQLMVDTYAVQHAGGPHPDKSVDIHLVGMYLALERGMRSTDIPPLEGRLGSTVDEWPHFAPPARAGDFTILDVALGNAEEHNDLVTRWAVGVWRAWSDHHDAIARLATENLWGS